MLMLEISASMATFQSALTRAIVFTKEINVTVRSGTKAKVDSMGQNEAIDATRISKVDDQDLMRQ